MTAPGDERCCCSAYFLWDEFCVLVELLPNAWLLVIYVSSAKCREWGSAGGFHGGGMNQGYRGNLSFRRAAWAVAGVTALAVALPGCGTQVAGRPPQSPSAHRGSAQAARGATPEVPGTIRTASAPGTGGTAAAAPGADGTVSVAPGTGGTNSVPPRTSKTSARTTAPAVAGRSGTASAAFPSPGARAVTTAHGSVGRGCPTAGIGGDPVPPPCAGPAPTATSRSLGITGPVTPTPTTSGRASGPSSSPSFTPSALSPGTPGGSRS